jgi:hypothetical protein
MGKRAVIGFKDKSTGIYLHWNGGEESVRAFLECARTYGVRDPVRDSYGIARLVQIIGNFFGGSLSIGLGNLESLDCDNFDNGFISLGKIGRLSSANITATRTVIYLMTRNIATV